MSFAFLFLSFLIFPLNLITNQKLDIKKPIPEIKKALAKQTNIKVSLTPTVFLTPIPIPTQFEPTQGPVTTSPVPVPTSSWGVAKQVAADTYSINVQNDSQMATPQEILNALNVYRQVHGVRALFWDNSLGSFAQSRSDQFNRDQKLDNHAGFNSVFSDSSNMKKYGYMKMGENSSIGYTLDGTHIIEWVYASDAPHNNNQLDPAWTNVGIGVSGNATDLVFGGN